MMSPTGTYHKVLLHELGEGDSRKLVDLDEMVDSELP
jgi:hypothetical protein